MSRAFACDVCGTVAVDLLVVGASYDGDDQETALCPDCASLVFPGLSDFMASQCPDCSPYRFN
jgi:hypothetical protein